MGCGPSRLRQGEAQAMQDQKRRGGGDFQKVALDSVLPEGMMPIRKVQTRESHAEQKVTELGDEGNSQTEGTPGKPSPPKQHDLRSGSSLPWVADEGSTVVMIDTIELVCDGVSRASLVSRPDTYLTISSSSNTKHVFTTPVRREELATAEWAVRVPLLARADTDDIITIQVWDKDILTPDDEIAEVYLSTHKLLEHHAAAMKSGKGFLEIEGMVGLLGVDDEFQNKHPMRINLTTEVQVWDDSYKVHCPDGKVERQPSEWDPYFRLLLTATTLSAQKCIEDGGVKAGDIRPPAQFGEKTETVMILDNRIELLAEDVQVPLSSASPFFFKFLNGMEFKSTAADAEYFTDRIAAETYVQTMLGSMHSVLVSTEGAWGNVASDASFTRYLFSNNGSMFLHKTAEGYECRLDFMRKFAVREGFERYGSTAFFDPVGKPTKIVIDGKTTEAGSEGWEWAKLQSRTTAFVACSGNHLIKAHYLWASIPNVAMTKCLNPDHPVRRLLHVHFFRSANTCLNSLDTLISEGGLVHRATGFTYEGLLGLFDVTLENFTFQSFEDELAGRGHTTEDPNFPVRTDGLAFRAVLEGYVSKYLGLYYDGDADVVADAELQKFGAYIGKYIKGTPTITTLDDAVQLLTELLFRVTGYHQHVGNVNIAGTSPVMVSDHLSKDHLLASVQSATLLALITALTAGMLNKLGADQYPPLLNDWGHLLLDRPARKVFKSFQAELRRLKLSIEARNNRRLYTFNDFNPAYCKLSVSS